uniref:Calpain catalytic domain-containing protein n=1 Tax=Acrobeloides nanus TaxID=290746 RepID=A0A914CZX1_9BILA
MVCHRDKHIRSLQAQNYRQLRKECLKKKQLFVDVTFPPTNSSLFLDQDRTSEIVWKRPEEIIKDPKLFVEGASPNDVTQGILGNCWFVSACSALTHNEELIKKVIPDARAQEWSDENVYCGIFRFCFWRYGSWFEIVIDDLLPTKDGKLLFARSKTPNEFWSALLEKAFAKLYGCYENLVGGQLADALQDVSGGVAETINVKKVLADGPTKDSTIRLFKTLQTAFDHQALIVAAIAAKSKEDIEKSLSCGLVKGHAYAVTAVRYIELDAKSRSFFNFFSSDARQMMIRLQNPWGEREWNGPWSDGSPEWEQVTPAQKAELGITVDEDGEFWMPWEEFVKYFTDISVCQLFNTGWFGFSKEFNEYIFFDEWTTNGVKLGDPKDRSGGCQNFAATFCFNPQYQINIASSASDVMIALSQKEVYNENLKQREPFVTIGIHVMKVELNRHHRIHQAINPVGTSDYASARSVYLHLTNLDAGRYIIMPTTYAPREQAEFMLRIYSKEDIETKLLKKDMPKSIFLITCHKVLAVSRLKIIEATFTTPRDTDIYCYIKADHDKARTSTIRASYTAKWDEMFIFYRYNLQQEYHLEIWEDHTLKDKPIGKCFISAAIDNDTRTVSLDIESTTTTSKESIGKLTLEISSFDDPMYL